MIPNLNFYDIYGYLLPGLTLLSLIWLPFGLIQRQLPSEKWSSAFVAIVLGYIAGHILQIIVQSTLPSDNKYYFARRFPSDRILEADDSALTRLFKTRLAGRIKDCFGIDSDNKYYFARRFPSDRILDADDSTLTQLFKTRLAGRIKECFGIAVEVERQGPDFANDQLKRLSQARVEAWFLCRSTLLTGKANSYGEQFQGLSVLMRGLAGAFGLGLIYHFGFVMGSSLQVEPNRGPVLVLAIIYVFVTIVLATDGERFGLQRPGLIPSVYALFFAVIGFLLASKLGNWSWIAVVVALSSAILALPITEPSRFKQARLLIAWFKVLPLLFAAGAVGYSLGSHWHFSVNQSMGMITVVIVEVFVAFKCYTAYGFFGKEFAKAIYQSFSTMQLSKDQSETAVGLT